MAYIDTTLQENERGYGGDMEQENLAASYCLNLHERYSPEWGVWEVARELFANAKDAAPGTMTITSPDANTLAIYTPTEPDIAELFIIGCGSKAPGGDDIGQFGEGVKLAALAATRSSGSLTIRLAAKTIRFELKDHFGQRVLFANVAPSDPFVGCLCTLSMEGGGYALNGKIIEGAESHTIAKSPDLPAQIFCKGIWICAMDVKRSLFSYNLNTVTLNRDRSHADPWSIKHSVGSLLVKQMTDTLAERLVNEPDSWESDQCLTAMIWTCPDAVKATLAAAVFRVHGEKAVLLTDPTAANRASAQGWNPVMVGEGLRALLDGHVPTDVVVIGRGVKPQSVPFRPEWSAMHDELMSLAAMLDATSVFIDTYADQRGDVVGQADMATRTVWLNERLWHRDNRFERIRTFVHELAHLQSGGADVSAQFESSLDLIGGKLAILLLDAQPEMAEIDSKAEGENV